MLKLSLDFLSGLFHDKLLSSIPICAKADFTNTNCANAKFGKAKWDKASFHAATFPEATCSDATFQKSECPKAKLPTLIWNNLLKLVLLVVVRVLLGQICFTHYVIRLSLVRYSSMQLMCSSSVCLMCRSSMLFVVCIACGFKHVLCAHSCMSRVRY